MRQTNHETKECLVIKAKSYIVSIPLKVLGTMNAAEILADAKATQHALIECPFKIQLIYAIRAAKEKGLAWCKRKGRVEKIIYPQSSDKITARNSHIQGIMI